MINTKKLCVAACFIFCGTVGHVQAAPFSLGMAFQRVQADYPEARVDQSDRFKVLTLPNQQLDGVSWRAIRFQFDAADRLSAVTLKADAVEQSNVHALIVRELQQPQTDRRSIDLDVPDDVEMRLCENSATGFELTIRRPSYVL